MRSEFEPKRIREAKETLGRQLERVQQMQQDRKVQEHEVPRASASVFGRLVDYLKRLL